MNREFRLGLFFLVALIIVGFVSLTVSQWTPPWAEVYTVTVDFASVEGLRPGDPVRVSGVQCGSVRSIELEEKRVRVVLMFEKKIRLREGYAITIQESALIGGRFVDVAIGPEESPFADVTRPLKGTSLPAPVQELSRILHENREDLHKTIENIQEVTRSIREGPGTLHELISDKQLYDKIDKIATNLESFSEKLNTPQGTAGKLVNDPALYDDLRTVAADLKAITNRIQNGPGTITTLLYDAELSKDLRSAVEDIRGSAASLREILEKIQSGEKPLLAYTVSEEAYKGAERAIQDFGTVVGRAARIQFWLGADTKHYADSKLDVSRISLRLQPGDDKYFLAGAAFLSLHADGDLAFQEQISSGGDDTRIVPEIEAAYRMSFLSPSLDPLWMRLGLIEGKPGGGLDLEWKDSLLFGSDLLFTLEARDAYGSVSDEDIDENLSGPLVRGYATAKVWKGFKAYAGVSRIGDRPELMAGAGFEYNDEDLRSLVALLGLK